MPYKDPQKNADYHQHYRDTHKKESQEAHKLRQAKRKEWINGLKLEKGCIRCGEKRLPCLQFHHRDPKEKELRISLALYRWPKEKVLAEIAKCDVLCANCHCIEHYS